MRRAEQGSGDRVQDLDVVGVAIEGLHTCDPHAGRLRSGHLVDPRDDRFPRRHRIVGVLGDEEDLVASLPCHGGHRGGHGRASIPHCAMDRDAGAERGG